MRPTTLTLLLSLSCFLWYQDGHARSLFLNGIDISSARHQEMERVTVRIDGAGNVYIVAPHYQVNNESTYIPLSNWNRPPGLPGHGNVGNLMQQSPPLKERPHKAPKSQPVTSLGGSELKKQGSKKPNPEKATDEDE